MADNEELPERIWLSRHYPCLYRLDRSSTEDVEYVRAPVGQEQWQPIETAPTKGRTPILLWREGMDFAQNAFADTWWVSGFPAGLKPTRWALLPGSSTAQDAAPLGALANDAPEGSGLHSPGSSEYQRGFVEGRDAAAELCDRQVTYRTKEMNEAKITTDLAFLNGMVGAAAFLAETIRSLTPLGRAEKEDQDLG